MKLLLYCKQEVSLKKIIVEGYRAVHYLNDSLQSSNFFVVVVVLYGKTYKLAIKRPIKIRTHHVVRKHTHRPSCTGGQIAGRKFRWTDGQI